MGCFDPVKNVIRNITIEPVFFLFALSHGLIVIASKNLYIAKVCVVNFNYSTELCNDIQKHKELQVTIQEYVASLQAYNSVIQAIPPCFYVLVAGPWSDRHGRKMLMVFCLFGYVISNGVFLINTIFFKELKAEYLLFECLQDLTGGSAVFFMASYSYIADITSVNMRTKRIAYLDGLFPLGFYIGNALSGPMNQKLGFEYNFSLGMLFAILAMAYNLIVVKDSSRLRKRHLAQEIAKELKEFPQDKKKVQEELEHEFKEKVEEDQGCCKGIFQVANIKEGFAAVLKKREHNKRLYIILLIVVFVVEFFCNVGMWNNMYLYLRRTLEWDGTTFGRFTTIMGVIGLIAQYIVVPFLSNKLKLHDSTISLLDCCSSAIKYLILAFATEEWMLYVGGVLAILDSTTTTLIRSLISKCVHSNEVGRVFSVVGVFQALVPFASGPLFGYVYRKTVATRPNAFIFIIVALKMVSFFIVLVVNIGMRREEKKAQDILASRPDAALKTNGLADGAETVVDDTKDGSNQDEKLAFLVNGANGDVEGCKRGGPSVKGSTE